MRLRELAPAVVVTVGLGSALVACGDDKKVADPEAIRRSAEIERQAPRTITLPDLDGKTDDAATGALARRGLRVRRKQKPSSEKAGTVIGQSPRPGEVVAAGTRVTLVLSGGPAAPPAPSGPYGALTASAVGPVKVGADSKVVESLFGQPERKEPVNLGVGGPAPQIDWIWHYPDGDLRINFETKGGTVTGYSSGTSTLATVSGIKPGSPFGPIESKYGDQLTESPFGGPNKNGDGAYLLSEGEPGTQPALTFVIENDVITDISGGEPQAAGE